VAGFNRIGRTDSAEFCTERVNLRRKTTRGDQRAYVAQGIVRVQQRGGMPLRGAHVDPDRNSSASGNRVAQLDDRSRQCPATRKSSPRILWPLTSRGAERLQSGLRQERGGAERLLLFYEKGPKILVGSIYLTSKSLLKG
jgi:hypothetical protein